MITTEISYRVLYAHTDKMGIVNNARYLEYFEAGRGDMLRKIGYTYKDMEQKNIALPLIEAYCKYIGAAKYDDILVVKCFMNNIPTVKTKIDYEIFVDGKLIATGFTVHSFVDLIKIKPVRPPKDFIELIKTYF
ncbi:MAG TPA: thioesterase family protein [Ignavibacteria bacterium]